MENDKYGVQPVRVLPHNIEEWFLNIAPGFADEFNSEVDFNNLNGNILYNIHEGPIQEVAKIDFNHQITINENYNQFLWSLSYSLLVLFNEGIHKPITEKRFKGLLDDTPLVREAWSLFEETLNFSKSYNRCIFFNFPNPETTPDNYFVLKANSIYSAAMTFILLHEFSHHYYGHLNYPSSGDKLKKEEFDADNYAISRISENFSNESAVTNKTGVIIGILSLMFLSADIKGGETHPDLDERLKNAIELLELKEKDNLWGLAALGLNLWSRHFNYDMNIPLEGDRYKDLFYHSYNQLYYFKQ